MIFRCILSPWAQDGRKKSVVEGEFTDEYLHDLNRQGYSIYFFPNPPSIYNGDRPVRGSDIDNFYYVFVDMDLKSKYYESKDQFLKALECFKLEPSFIVDSGNGVHAYWGVNDLDALSFLRLQRRLCRYFTTDEAVSKICQIMRAPGFLNVKQEQPRQCDYMRKSDKLYTCEDLDKALPIITKEDEEFCKRHYDSTFNKTSSELLKVDDKLPQKFALLLKDSKEVSEIWKGNTDDRSASDWRLAHIMWANGFTKDEAMSVLVNTAKAMARVPIHRIGYAKNIVDKIWVYEENSTNESSLTLSKTVKEILQKGEGAIKGERFSCDTWIDNTYHGFRLGQVIGLVGGSGVGKTSLALNMFEGFVRLNPNYEHFFISLEQPANEIADRWRNMSEGNDNLHEKVHVLSNYEDDGSFRHLSLDEIKNYLVKFQEVTGKKVGCVVIDHIGALKKKNAGGENQDLIDICHSMKAFAIQTNTLLVMQSQASRQKAGIGDLELFKDAAYGTVYFESYCDYLITLWQPLKSCYSEAGCPTIMAFKFCKIRHKKKGVDMIQEDVPYRMFFDPITERLRVTTREEEKSFDFFNKKALSKRKEGANAESTYQSVTWTDVRTSNKNN